MRYLYNMENFLVVKVQASIRQQMIYQSMVEEQARMQARMQAHAPAHMQSVPGPIATSAYTPTVNNHASWLFDAYLSHVHSDR